MKPKWVREAVAAGVEIRNVDFYVPEEEYKLILKAKGRQSWRKFLLAAAAKVKPKNPSQRSSKGKGES